MLLHRIHLDRRCREARRDLADPYQMHSTLCRAFCEPDRKCPDGEFLWRLEPETDSEGHPRILIQSRSLPVWSHIPIKGWFALEPDPPVDLNRQLKTDSLEKGQRFRFRIRANPCVTRQGKRIGLLQLSEQEEWIERQGREHAGFALPRAASFVFDESSPDCIDVRVSQEQMLRGKQPSGNDLTVFSVLYDGMLIVTDPDAFKRALQSGIGHGKSLGLGLLSVVPAA